TAGGGRGRAGSRQAAVIIAIPCFRRCCFLPVMGGCAKTQMTLTTRLAIAMIALVAIAVSAVGWLSYRSLEQAVLPRVLDRIETHSRLAASELESQVRTARGDIATFHGLAAVAGLMRARLNGGIDPT